MKTQKRRANPLRRAYHDIVRQEIVARPGCALVHSIGVDEDGRTYIHFTCLSHDSASWRYYIHVYVDTELAAQTYIGSELSSRCPARGPYSLPLREEVPEEDSSAPASQNPLSQSLEECDPVADEVLE